MTFTSLLFAGNKKTTKIKRTRNNKVFNYKKKEVKGKTEPQIVELDLLDIINMALLNNPKIKQQWLNIKVGEENYSIKKADWLPGINGAVSYESGNVDYKNNSAGKMDTDSSKWNAALEMNYLLFDFGGRESDIANFKHKLSAIRYDTNSYVRNFIYDVIKSYYSVLSTMANEVAAIDSEKSSYEAFKAAETRYKVGFVALTDKLQAETQYNKEILNRKKAENTYKNKKAELNYLLNLSPSENLNLKGIQFYEIDEEIDIDINILIDIALLNRSELKSIDSTRKAKESEIFKNKTARFPSINLQARYGMVGDMENKNNIINDTSNTFWNVGIKASIPFFTGGSISSNISKSKTELEIIKEQASDLKRNIELDVWNAYQDFVTAKQSYDSSIVVLNSAKEAEKNIFGRYKSGKSSMLDLLNAQSNLSSARYEYINSQYNWFIQRANLIRAIGTMEFEEAQNVIKVEKEEEEII
ncbi:MAG: TolC family protein [Rickettsiales bacterium]|nr:TolC family protein [Rickettsiales bacterium]